MSGFLTLVIPLIVLLYWWDSIRSKEIARQAGKLRCQQHGLQFLDDTVSLAKIRFRRGSSGRLSVTRQYQFEFCTDGSKRYQGTLWVTARYAHGIEMEPYAITESNDMV